jgi:hypothetical protein
MRRPVLPVLTAVALVFVSLSTPALAKGFDKGAPAGIMTTTTTLAAVLSAHQKAIGKAADTRAAVVEEGTFATSGLAGRYREVRLGSDFVETTTVGPFTSSFGERDGQGWWQDDNGLVVRPQGVHQRGKVDAQALDAALTKPDSGVHLLGEVHDPIQAYVVEVNPPDGRRMWVFFDKATALIDRTESLFPTRRVISTYTDFKAQGGSIEPWSGHSTDGDPKNDYDWHITSLQSGAAVDDSTLDVPASRQAVEFPSGEAFAKLPARIINGRIIVTLVVGGRGYDFLLDSGASDINVDYSAVKQMGLTLYGKSGQEAAGKFDASRAVIPELNVGNLKMRQVAVNVLPYTEDLQQGIEVVGLLGFDFIAGATIHVDYYNRSVEAQPIGQYIPPADAFPVPVALDDGVPVLAAQIGTAIGDHFILDTGADNGYVFPTFAASHRADLTDQGRGSMISDYSPFMSAQGVGGTISLKPTQVASFQLAGVDFRDWVVYTMTNDYAQEAEDYDGLIGYDFLKYFTVVFDYRDSMIFLEPNQLFRENSTHS